MKLLTIVYDSAIDRSLMGLLEELQVKSWTKAFALHGQGEAGLKVSTPVWPGTNYQLLIAGEEDTMRETAHAIRELQDEFKLRPGIFMCLQDVEEV